MKKKKLMLAVCLIISLIFSTGCSSTSEDEMLEFFADRAENFEKDDYSHIKYTKLARHPKDYETRDIKIRGEVFQVIENTDDDYTTLLLRVGGDWDKIMLVYIYNEFLDTRVFEGDEVRCYGLFAGLQSYENFFDMTQTVPMMYADKIYILNDE